MPQENFEVQVLLLLGELREEIGAIRSDVAGVKEHLAKSNGRLGKVEDEVKLRAEYCAARTAEVAMQKEQSKSLDTKVYAIGIPLGSMFISSVILLVLLHAKDMLKLFGQ